MIEKFFKNYFSKIYFLKNYFLKQYNNKIYYFYIFSYSILLNWIKKIKSSNIGLDPAFPLFYPSECHLRSSDAKAVIILHTDGGFYGTPFNTGTVDFYANKGISPQPGCPPTIGRGRLFVVKSF